MPKHENTTGKADLDIAAQNHPPDSRNLQQETAGSVSGGSKGPNSPAK